MGGKKKRRSKFYVIDGLAMIYRAIMVKGPRLTTTHPDGVVEVTKGTFYFTRMLLKLIREKKPDYFAVTMDARRETLFRRDIYPSYKKRRSDRSAEEMVQVTRCMEICRALGIPIIEFPRHEADDIIATLCDICAGDECQVVIVSRDKDLHQLIGPNVIMYDAMREEFIGQQEVEDRWGVPPDRVPDVQALMGDPTDDVPGVVGIGEKGAKELIREFGSLDSLIANIEDVPGKRGDLIHEASENGTIDKMRRLVYLKRDLEIILDPDELTWNGPNMKAAKVLFRKLGFRRWSG